MTSATGGAIQSRKLRMTWKSKRQLAGSQCETGSRSQPTEYFAHLCDVLHPNAKVGSLFNDIHPDHGIFSPILVNAYTKEMIPVATLFDVEQFLRDLAEITDHGRRPAITKAMVSLSVLRNFDQDKAPSGFGFSQLRELLEDCFYRVAGSGVDWSQQAYSYKGSWKLVMISAMIFQDLFNYDLSTMSDSTTLWQHRKVK